MMCTRYCKRSWSRKKHTMHAYVCVYHDKLKAWQIWRQPFTLRDYRHVTC